jgi:hypothetical protein
MRESIVVLLIAAIVLSSVWRGRRWAQVVVVVASFWWVWGCLGVLVSGRLWLAWGWLGVLISGRHFLAMPNAAVALFGASYLGVATLLVLPHSNQWFRREATPSWGLLTEQPVHLQITWIVFFASIVVVHLSYWEGGTARQGNPLVGVVASLSGTYLSLAYASRSLVAAKSQGGSSSPIRLLGVSAVTFAVAIIFPAKSLTYLVLLSIPLQLVTGCAFLAFLSYRARREPRAPRRYVFLVSLASAALFALLVALVVRISVSGIH